MAPAKTPPDIIARLAAKSVEVLKTPAISEHCSTTVSSDRQRQPTACASASPTKVPKWRDIIAKSGIKPV